MNSGQNFKDIMRDAIGKQAIPEVEMQNAMRVFHRFLEESGGRIFSTFSGNTRNYAEILALLLASEVRTLHDALWDTLPRLHLTVPRPGYVAGTNGTFEFRQLETGDRALFWTGTEMEVAEFDAATHRSADFLALSEKIGEFLKSRAFRHPVIVDIGAGIGALSLYLADHLHREEIHGCRIVNVERDMVAAVASELLVQKSGVGGLIENIVADLKPAIEGDEHLWRRLDSIIARTGPQTALIVVTRAALHPYFVDDQYEKMFSEIIRRLRPVAGFHLELVGDRTPAFAHVASYFPSSPFIDDVYRRNTSDPLAFLRRRALSLGLEIQEDVGVWPQFVQDRLFSYLSWKKSDTAS